MKRVLSLAVLLLFPTATTAQTADTPPVLSRTVEVALARSAAPEHVSRDATILVLHDGRYTVAVDGPNGVTCIVSRSQPLSLEPICYDPEASRTILPMEVARVEARLAGVPVDDVEARLDSMIAGGEMALPARPAMAYMMSAGQVLYADAETRVGSWVPHIHLYVPNATAKQFGGFSEDMNPAVGLVVDEGEPTANLIIKVREFVEPSYAGDAAPIDSGEAAGASKGGKPMSQAQQDRRMDYIEFPATDIQETSRFYSAVFGWKFIDYGPDYTSFGDGRLNGGFRAVTEVSRGGPLVVVYATDLEEIEKLVVENGGRIVQETFEFPGGRRFHFTDPSGNELAVWSE
jgi:predicted enzyme related to lactoylglutathione lyase